MIPVILLAVLAFVDAGFCGFRAAAGRNARLFLGSYYRRSVRRALVFGGAIILLVGCVAMTGLALGDDGTWNALVATASRMVLVYGVFATMVLVALGLYLIGRFDLAVLATVLVLGPFTLVRPAVIVLGGAWAAWMAPTPFAAVLALAAAATMVSFERLLAIGRPPWTDALALEASAETEGTSLALDDGAK